MMFRFRIWVVFVFLIIQRLDCEAGDRSPSQFRVFRVLVLQWYAGVSQKNVSS